MIWGSMACFLSHSMLVRRERRAQRLTCWVRRPPGGVGFFHAKGCGRKARSLPRKFVSLGFRRADLGCPGNFGRDFPDCLGCSKLRWPGSHASIRRFALIRANHVRVPELNPFFLQVAFRGTKICESQV